MGAICGVWRRRGPGTLETDLPRMLPHLRRYGTGASGWWPIGPVGLGYQLPAVPRQEPPEDMPVRLASGRHTLVCIARIDNRDDLVRRLGLDAAQGAALPDGHLLGRAFERWGEACVDHAVGDWTLAAWDGVEQRLFLTRGHTTGAELFYYDSPDLFAFASSTHALLALPDVPREPDELRVVQSLTAWRSDAHATTYRHIAVLPNGHSLQATAGSTSVRQYWRLADTPDVVLGPDQAYVDAFLDVYGEAVRCRLRGVAPIAGTLSSGLDSGSITALAAPMLRERGQRLTAFTSAPLLSTSGLVTASQNPDEQVQAAQVAELVGNIDLRVFRAESTTPLAGVRRMVEEAGNPDFGVGNSYWLSAVFDECRALGIGTLLVGSGGNFTTSWNGGEFASNWTRWPPRLADLHAWRTNRGRSFSAALKALLIRPLVPTALLDWRASRASFPSWQQYSALNPALAEELRLVERMRDTGHDPGFAARYEPDRRRAHYPLLDPNRRMITASAAWHHAGAHQGVDVRDPTLDKRVVEFCLAIPRDQFVRDGTTRWLIRRAMTGRLPREVLYARKRGRQAADLALRVRASRDEIDVALQQMEASPLASRFLDLPRMRAVLDDTQGPLSPGIGSRSDLILMRGLSAGLFLLQFEQPRP